MTRIELEQRIAALETKVKNLQLQVDGLASENADLAGRVEGLRTTFKEWLANLREDVRVGA